MKKLNRKGFTLIELLAIIVILAIIMVVTVPTVLSSMGDARKTTLQNSANAVADWIEKEYTMAQLRQAEKPFTDVCGDDGKTCESETNIMSLLTVAGVKQSNYSSATVIIKTSGRACVKLTASNTGEFETVTDKTVQSTGC